MPLPTNSGPIPSDTSGKFNRCIVPTQDDSFQPGLIIVNPDGSSVLLNPGSTENNQLVRIFNFQSQLVISNGPARIKSLYFQNNAAFQLFVLLFNVTAFPINGTPSIYSFRVPPSGGSIVINDKFWGKLGIPFDTGITFSLSTTPDFQTLAAGSAGGHVIFTQ